MNSKIQGAELFLFSHLNRVVSFIISSGTYFSVVQLFRCVNVQLWFKRALLSPSLPLFFLLYLHFHV